VLDLTRPNDVIFGSSPVAIFRRHAWFYPTLYWGVLRRYEQGDIRPSLPDELRRRGCTLIVESYPPRLIPKKDRDFVRERFVRLEPFLLVPGQAYSAERLSQGPVVFDALVTGTYQVEAAAPLFVDGGEVSGEVFLEAGLHTLECAAECSPAKIYRLTGQ
jgi:hypothetical protein